MCIRDSRKVLLQLALESDRRGVYSARDVALIQFLLHGDFDWFVMKKTFREKLGRQRPRFGGSGDRMYEEVYRDLTSHEQVGRLMEYGPISHLHGLLFTRDKLLNLDLRNLREGDSRNEALELFNQSIAMFTLPEASPIWHTVMIVVNTLGEVLSRTRRYNQFSKLGCGGGMWRKGFLHCHFACREGVMDEFGISFHNPAVLAISEPQIQLRNPEQKMRGYCDMFQGTWMQVMVVDAKQVKEDSVNKRWNARTCLLYTSPSPRDATLSRMPSSA